MKLRVESNVSRPGTLKGRVKGPLLHGCGHRVAVGGFAPPPARTAVPKWLTYIPYYCRCHPFQGGIFCSHSQKGEGKLACSPGASRLVPTDKKGDGLHNSIGGDTPPFEFNGKYPQGSKLRCFHWHITRQLTPACLGADLNIKAPTNKSYPCANKMFCHKHKYSQSFA